jgi:hypothetical protein
VILIRHECATCRLVRTAGTYDMSPCHACGDQRWDVEQVASVGHPSWIVSSDRAPVRILERSRTWLGAYLIETDSGTYRFRFDRDGVLASVVVNRGGGYSQVPIDAVPGLVRDIAATMAGERV